MRCHIKKHPRQTDTHKTVMYEIKQMSPEPHRPKRQTKNTSPLTTKPYFNKMTSTKDYIYQQSLRPNQRPMPQQLIPIDIPEKTTRKDFIRFSYCLVIENNAKYIYIS